ncbi:EDD domain protein, DegV family [Carnobacterium iners]|uniref:EDD domain protein, DegV family n=1 Tax=Carnobacterium iners TaxID=1073423 RepID=A0A1X7NLM0_9LACT|nr:DegV family protein [Carnobacterium iners]SEK83160.1 EDD domain protein, DegV family [Carnobacterium iners]SMH38211.1 EDD domain protein, DegV family [Carnobacterium iners]
MTYKIMTDACCDLPLDFVEENGIHVINMTINLNGNEYLDDLGKTFDREAFFQSVKNGEIATTSQINIGTYFETFKYYIENNEPVLYLAFSSGLSGSYNNAMAAVEMLKEEYGLIEVTVVDTLAACLGEGLLIYEAVQLKKMGKSLVEVAQWIEENKLKLHSWVTVEDIKHLERGGRISAVSATLGTLLNVKPIIIMNRTGNLVPFAKVRGRKKSLQYLVQKTIEGIVEPEKQTLFIGHVGVPEEAIWIKNTILDKMAVKDIQIYPYGPTIAAHTGFGSIAVFSFGEIKK